MSFFTKKGGIFLFLLFLCGSVSFGQGVTKASITGDIVDNNGAPLPGANIIAVHNPTGTQYGTSSREDGRYNMLGLRTGGPYTVTVSFVGFTTQEKTDVYLELGQEYGLDFTLADQSITLSGVTVVAESNPILSENRTGASQAVSIKDIETLPTISRRFQDFAKLSPMFNAENYQAAGRSNKYNNIQIDGAYFNDAFGLGTTGTPGAQTLVNPISLDAVQEFQVVVAPFDVRQGGFTGGGINAITRSGTNKLSGSAFYYFRNESFVGDATFKDENQAFPEFKELQTGFRLGGPIMKDKMFFFLNGEITERDDPLSNVALEQGVEEAGSKAQRFADILKNTYGYDPGTFNTITAERPSQKLFGRIDYNISRDHKLSLRHNYVNSSRDRNEDRGRASRLTFSTYTHEIENETNSTVAELNSTFGNNMSNNLIVGFTSMRTKRANKNGDRPEIRVDESGVRLLAGGDRFSSANELDQDIFEITNNFTYFAGDHTFTIGTHNEFLSIRNLFIEAFHGYYRFRSLDDLENGVLRSYQRRISVIPGEVQPSAEFSAYQFGIYAQDEWRVTPDLKLTLGVRVDIPTLPDEPDDNVKFRSYWTDYSTSDVPSGNILFSPRLGFNWDITGDRSTQLRGGVGIFSGGINYVLISNNYSNTGTFYQDIVGGADIQNLQINMDPNNQPELGDPGTAAGGGRAELNVVDPDLKLPEVLRFNLGVDHQLPYDIVASADFIYSKTLNDFFIQKLNLRPQTGTLADGRPVYGGTDNGPDGSFADIWLLANTDEGYQYNLSVQLQRNVFRGLSGNVGYTFGRSEDINSMTSSRAVSNFRFNPIGGNPNDPELATSKFEVRHRVFFSLSYSAEFFTNAMTTFSLFYNGQSGAPFSYMVDGDVNNDGRDTNDLFYIPAGDSEILLGSVDDNGVYTSDPAMYTAFNQFIEANDYLKDNRGKMSERNADNSPWRDIFDIRIMQDIPDLWGMGHFQISLDVLNVLNLLNSEWGRWEQITFDYNVVEAVGTDAASGQPVYEFVAPQDNSPFSFADGEESRWAMQFGIRYSF